MSHLRLFAPAIAMVMLAVAAFGVPWFGFDDVTEGVDPAQFRRFEDRGRHWADIPSLNVQVIEIEATGPDPHDVEGRVVLRTLFGVPWNELELGIRGGQSNGDISVWFWTLAAFLGVESALGVWQFRRLATQTA